MWTDVRNNRLAGKQGYQFLAGNYQIILKLGQYQGKQGNNSLQEIIKEF